MTFTLPSAEPGGPPRVPKRRRPVVAVVTAAMLGAGGLGAGLALSLAGSSTPTSAPPAPSATSAYAYYQQVMGRYGIGSGSMMGGSSYGWMMGRSGYAWMMGGTGAPGWMTGGSLPSFMMGASTDMGTAMGQLFADAPGPRISPAPATRLGAELPSGAVVDRAANRITFSGHRVSFTVLASPSMPNENFRIAGLTDPTLVVSAGAKVTVEFINADADMAHGLVVTRSSSAASSWMPMVAATPAFAGSALWFLGESTSAGMHEGTLSFTASAPGTYEYLCPVPGHAEEGMAGSFVVSGNR